MSPGGIRGVVKGIHSSVVLQPQGGGTEVRFWCGGGDGAKQIWVEYKVETQVEGLKCLAGFARAFTQIEYFCLTMLLQQEWNFSVV